MATVTKEFASSAGAVTAVEAIELDQSGFRMYLTSLTGNQMVLGTTVDRYDSSLRAGHPDQGFQRPAERSRITRIGNAYIKGSSDGLWPNPVILGSRQPLNYEPLSRRLVLPDGQHKLRIIDGQHRIEGLRYAICEKDAKEVAYMQFPAVIVEIPDKMVEMEQFKVINGTAKPVRTDLVNMILTAIAEENGSDSIPEKDHWKVVATKTVDLLNRGTGSPWYDNLLMPDEVGLKVSGKSKVARATSAITSIRPIYEWVREYGGFAGLSFDEQAERLTEILAAYWRAIKATMPEAFENPDDYVIQKTPGLFALHYMLKDRLLKDIRWGRREWDEETFQEFIQSCSYMTDAAFWHKSNGSASAYGSMKGFRELADQLIGAYDDQLKG